VISELNDQIELVAVVNRTLEKAEKITAVRGGTAFTSLTEAMAATAIDVVVSCTPAGGRAEVAIEALEAGKHLIIEKPAEVSLTKIDDIIAAQQKAGTQVTVISQHRFDPASEVALAAIKDGELGRLTSGIASIDLWRGTELLRFSRLACDLESRRWRRPDEPGCAHCRPAGSHAWHASGDLRVHRHLGSRAD
jgi:UDP-N-acetyl-2-amino-2-deoxyglucuronate dehydrogenase